VLLQTPTNEIWGDIPKSQYGQSVMYSGSVCELLCSKTPQLIRHLNETCF